MSKNDKPTDERIADALERLVKIQENKEARKDAGRKPFWNGDTLGEPWWPGK